PATFRAPKRYSWFEKRWMRRSIEMLGHCSPMTFSSRMPRYSRCSDWGSVCSSMFICVKLGWLSLRILSSSTRDSAVCACKRLTSPVFRLANASPPRWSSSPCQEALPDRGHEHSGELVERRGVLARQRFARAEVQRGQAAYERRQPSAHR